MNNSVKSSVVVFQQNGTTENVSQVAEELSSIAPASVNGNEQDSIDMQQVQGFSILSVQRKQRVSLNNNQGQIMIEDGQE